MRTIIKSAEFDAFFNQSPQRVQDKIDYSIYVIENATVLNSKLVKKLVGTEFYELRISMNNEYRIIIFCIDSENIIEATQLFFLNGFMKKSTKDYSKQIALAQRILENTK